MFFVLAIHIPRDLHGSAKKEEETRTFAEFLKNPLRCHSSGCGLLRCKSPEADSSWGGADSVGLRHHIDTPTISTPLFIASLFPLF